MALDYSYDPDTGGIWICGHGAVSVEDRVHFVRRLFGDPELPARAAVLIDVNGVTNAPSAADVRVIGMLIERLQSRFRGRVAIVNATVGHVTLSHLVALSVGNGCSEVRVFVSDAEASEWLRS